MSASEDVLQSAATDKITNALCFNDLNGEGECRKDKKKIFTTFTWLSKGIRYWSEKDP